jgi:hypothetical protein
VFCDQNDALTKKQSSMFQITNSNQTLALEAHRVLMGLSTAIQSSIRNSVGNGTEEVTCKMPMRIAQQFFTELESLSVYLNLFPEGIRYPGPPQYPRSKAEGFTELSHKNRFITCELIDHHSLLNGLLGNDWSWAHRTSREESRILRSNHPPLSKFVNVVLETSPLKFEYDCANEQLKISFSVGITHCMGFNSDEPYYIGQVFTIETRLWILLHIDLEDSIYCFVRHCVFLQKPIDERYGIWNYLKSYSRGSGKRIDLSGAKYDY